MRELEGVTLGWPDVLVADSRAALVRAIGAAQRRGELGAVGIPACTDVNLWHVRVTRVRTARRRRARWPWVAGGVAVVLAAATAAGWWLASAVALALPMAAGGVALLVVGSRLTRRQAPGCTVTVTHTHRH